MKFEDVRPKIREFILKRKPELVSEFDSIKDGREAALFLDKNFPANASWQYRYIHNAVSDLEQMYPLPAEATQKVEKKSRYPKAREGFDHAGLLGRLQRVRHDR